MSRLPWPQPVLWCLLSWPNCAQPSQQVMRVWGLRQTPAPVTVTVPLTASSAAFRHPHQGPVKGLRCAAMVSQVGRIFVQPELHSSIRRQAKQRCVYSDTNVSSWQRSTERCCGYRQVKSYMELYLIYGGMG